MYFKMKQPISIVLLCPALLLLAACGTNKPAAADATARPPGIEKYITIVDFGPGNTKAGEDFNVQPDGVSAFWFNTYHATASTVVVINGTVLPTTVQPNGKLVTAGVPKAVYAKAGEFPVYLLDQRTGERSNEVKFVVN